MLKITHKISWCYFVVYSHRKECKHVTGGNTWNERVPRLAIPQKKKTHSVVGTKPPLFLSSLLIKSIFNINSIQNVLEWLVKSMNLTYIHGFLMTNLISNIVKNT